MSQNISPLSASGVPVRQYVHLSRTIQETAMGTNESEIWTQVHTNNIMNRRLTVILWSKWQMLIWTQHPSPMRPIIIII